MSINLKYNEIKHQVDIILWDRDSFFIDFNSYWSRLVASIAQKVAENTTDNWNNFNLVRTQAVKILGINLDTESFDASGPVNILPLNIFPSLLANGLKDLIHKKNRDDLSDLFQTLIDKALQECQTYIKKSILEQNLQIVKKINKDSKQILITNDSKENNNVFIDEASLKNCFYKISPQTNKEQLDDLLQSNSIFITKNRFLQKIYLKKNIKNVLLVDDINNLSFNLTSNQLLIKINIDGASRGNPGPSAIGIAFYKEGELIDEISEFIGEETNNFAEYTALIRALEISLKKGYQQIEICSDSQLVVNQINKKYKVKDAYIKDLFDKANLLIDKFSSFKIVHVKREDNLRADKLANNALRM